MKEIIPTVVADVEVANEIGINAAVIVRRMHMWHERSKVTGYGKWVDGVHYVYNSYKQWHEEQFTWLSARGVRKIFDGLVDQEIVFKIKYHGTGWRQIRGWGLNYSHPICHLVSDRSVTKGQIDLSLSDNCLYTDTYQKKQQLPTIVGKTHTPTSGKPYNRTRSKQTRTDGEQKSLGIAARSSKVRWDVKDWPEVEKWLSGKNEDFRKQVWEYAELQVNNPKRKVDYPGAYKKSVVGRVWSDEIKGTHYSDFHFVDHEGLEDLAHMKTVKVEKISDQEFLRRKFKADTTPEEGMEAEYLKLQEEA